MTMPSRPINGLDHVLVGVRDLDAARAGFARLGLNSSPRGRHIGWGTANYCIMLEEDYIEILGIVDVSQFTNGLDVFLERREGLMGLALASADPRATHAAWRENGLTTAEFRPLKRLLEGEAGDIEVAFENVMLDRSETGGLSVFACHHLTPELLRRPGWTRHPVTATRLKSVTVLIDDPDAIAERLAPVFGRSFITRTDDVVAAHAGSAVMLFARPEDAAFLHPAFEFAFGGPGAAPVPSVLEIAIRDADAARRFLDLQDVAYGQEADGGITIQPEEAFGVAIEFTPGG